MDNTNNRCFCLFLEGPSSSSTCGRTFIYRLINTAPGGDIVCGVTGAAEQQQKKGQSSIMNDTRAGTLL